MTADPLHPPGAAAVEASSSILRRVLVVDDSRLQRRILASTLKKWNFEVVEAGSGEEALRLCALDPPDMILSDWVMPGVNGLEFCRAFRALDLKNYVYFILLTSKSDKGEIAQGLENGADDFLSKPVSAEELRARMAAGERILRVERELTEKNRLITLTLAQMERMHEALARDLDEARKLQISLVPRDPISFSHGRVSFIFEPSGHIGGDLVGAFPVGRNTVGLFSLDVSGHGIASALITARFAGWLSGSTPEQNVALEWCDGEVVMGAPDRVCQRLNALFLREIETEHYATIALASVDLVSGRARFCQAGHPHPMVQRSTGMTEFVGGGGMPIGLLEDAVFETVEIELGHGDRLFLYSDGVTECPCHDKSMIEEDGLSGLFEDQASVPGEILLPHLLETLRRGVQPGAFPDDVSGLLLEFGRTG